jgi:hypothetical protein
MNPIDTSQLNNSSRKTWNWSIRYGIDQLNSPIDQSLVLMVTMKQVGSGADLVYVAVIKERLSKTPELPTRKVGCAGPRLAEVRSNQNHFALTQISLVASTQGTDPRGDHI